MILKDKTKLLKVQLVLVAALVQPNTSCSSLLCRRDGNAAGRAARRADRPAPVWDCQRKDALHKEVFPKKSPKSHKSLQASHHPPSWSTEPHSCSHSPRRAGLGLHVLQQNQRHGGSSEWRGWKEVIRKVPSNPTHSVIPWRPLGNALKLLF